MPLTFDFTEEQLRHAINSGGEEIIAPHRIEWEAANDGAQTLTMRGARTEYDEYAVVARFVPRGRTFQLESTWIGVRSDGTGRQSPQDLLKRALAFQVRFMHWLERHPFAQSAA